MRCIWEDLLSDLTNRDKVIREDEDWQRAAVAHVGLKQQAKALVRLAKHLSESGFGVSVTRFCKQGNVDYKTVP